jgi:hypothetical protein
MYKKVFAITMAVISLGVLSGCAGYSAEDVVEPPNNEEIDIYSVPLKSGYAVNCALYAGNEMGLDCDWENISALVENQTLEYLTASTEIISGNEVDCVVLEVSGDVSCNFVNQ